MNPHDIVVTLNQWIPQAIIIFIAVGLLDWAVGILASLKQGQPFDLQKLPAQLENIFLPYLTPMVAALFAAPTIGDWKAVIVPFAVAATAKLLDDIRQKVLAFLVPAAKPKVKRA